MGKGFLYYLSHAKINLRLEVLGKRADGYHEIRSVMSLISLADRITIFKDLKKGIKIETDHPEIGEGEDNIVFRCVKKLLDRANHPGGVKIIIKKRIPIAAGLGGGSSNGAVSLLGVNRLLKLGFSKHELMDIGSSVGADIPFFLFFKPAIALGKGDILYQIPTFPTIWLILIVPNFHLYTKDVYNGLKMRLTQDYSDIKIKVFDLNIDNISDIIRNDLEKVSVRILPRIKELKELLLAEGAYAASMSGSGPAVFGIFESKDKAKEAKERIKEKIRVDEKIFLCYTI